MPRILVVDDDVAIVKLISVILSRAGHEVRTSSHPAATLHTMLDQMYNHCRDICGLAELTAVPNIEIYWL